jgi:uncharacterized membrane protein
LAFCSECGVDAVPTGGLCPVCRNPLPVGENETGAAAFDPVTWMDRIASAAAYLTPVAPLVLLLVPRFRRSPLVRFHALQSLLLQCALLLLAALLAVILLSWFSGMIVLIFWPIYAFAVFVLWVLLVVKAGMAERFRLPLVGWLALRASPE